MIFTDACECLHEARYHLEVNSLKAVQEQGFENDKYENIQFSI